MPINGCRRSLNFTCALALAGLLGFGCSSANGISASGSKNAGGNGANATASSPGAAAPSTPTATDGQALGTSSAGPAAPPAINGDAEGSFANQPEKVSGAYLTVACAGATTQDGAAPTGGDSAFGCAVQNQDGSRYNGPVQVHAITVGLTGTPASTQPPLVAPGAGSRFHVLFYLNGGTAARMTSIGVTGSAGTTAFQASTPASPVCTQQTVNQTYPNVYPYTMDSSRATTFGNNGSAPLPLFTTSMLQAGDTVTLTSVSGRTFYELMTLPNVFSACTVSWNLYFLDASGNLLNNASSAAIANFSAGEVVPAGTVSATLGFFELDPLGYVDNEGAPGVKRPMLSSNGCTFSFALTQTQCSL